MNCSESGNDPASTTLRLAGSLDAYAAAALRDELSRALNERPALAVELSDVESCDFTTIQLLCAARRAAERAGKLFSTRSLPESVGSVLASLGLSPEVFGSVRKD